MKKIIVFLLILLPFTVDAKVVKYLNDSNMITIDISDFGTSVSLNGKKDITIDNMGNYYTRLLGSEENYPRYLVFNEGKYTFSDTKSSGKSYVYSKYYGEISDLTTNAVENNCESIFGADLINLLKNNVFKIIYITIPIILLVFTTFDFAKVVFMDSKDAIGKAFQRFSKRALAAIMIFLVPTILIFLIEITGSAKARSCVDTFKTTNNIGEK